MKNLLVMTVSALLVAGCGGDGGQSTNSPVKDHGFFKEYYEFEPDYEEINPKIYQKISFKTDGDVLYASKLDSIDPSFVLSEKGLVYQDNHKYTQGFKVERIKKVDSNSITVSPFDINGNIDLEIKKDIQLIDLSDIPVNSRFQVENSLKVNDILFKDFFTSPRQIIIKKIIDKNSKFPKGSSCVRFISNSSNFPYLKGGKASQEGNLTEWVNEQKKSGEVVKTGEWSGYKWALVDYLIGDYTSRQGVAQIADELKYVVLEQHDSGVQYNINIYTKALQDLLDSNGDQTIIHGFQYAIKGLQTECHAYNKIAADALEKFIQDEQ